jgi:crossover junction endodeoxyribonuclease RusA
MSAQLQSVRFSLPWPPSVNNYWEPVSRPVKPGSRKYRAWLILSDRAKEYRILAINAMRLQRVPCGKLTGLLRIHVTCFPPDLRDRDLDNLLKGLLDSMAHAGIIRNDADFEEISMKRGPVVANGRIEVLIGELPGGATVSGDLFATAQQSTG